TLKDMPQSMDDISVNLTDSNQNLNSLKTGIDGVADSLAGFQTDITNAQGVITTYLTDLP
ncbi:MAG: hypothetical protein R6V43_03985, partial [Halopseudomonas sp.]